MRRTPAWIALACCAAWGAAAFAGPAQDALSPAGPQAAHIHTLWHVMLAVCTLVFAAVLAAFLIALWRAPRADAAAPPDLDAALRPERGARRSVLAAVAASTLLLVFLILASFLTDRALARLSSENAVRIEVTANQWWWEAKYGDPQPSRTFTTANELHIPVGRPVVLTLKSSDVIHSFWVPNLHGKRDLIPGRTTVLRLQADRAGAYRGQCAEFCGFEHAYMAFQLVAEPADRYEAWAEHQRQSAAEPGDDTLRRGRELFLTTTCVMCHAIQGTDASARRGPDLTHVGGRRDIAAGTMANTDDNLARWIRDPQRFKPGVNMPASNLPEDDLKAIVAYLRSLS
ncbi:cytochrome c oxidase subunit II [Pigmentiphaga soli]|uniref:cytochrome-c oxidase n=1 Tax=Pigmentiphaga soli TaxID=1007095 RepID=A0ABP8GVM8_9BURK